MGLQNLPDITGNSVSREDVNLPRAALRGNIVPRLVSGQPESQSGNLGTPDLQWNDLHIRRVFIDGVLLQGGGGAGVAIMASGSIGAGATIGILPNTSGFLYPVGDGRVELYASPQSPLVFSDRSGTQTNLTASVFATFPAVSATNRAATIGGATGQVSRYDGIHNSAVFLNGAQSEWENRRKRHVGVGIGNEVFVAYCDFIANQYILSQCTRGRAIARNSRTVLSPTENNTVQGGSVATLNDLYYLFIDPTVANPQITITSDIHYSHNTPPTDMNINIWARGEDNSLLVRAGSEFVAYEGIYIGLAIVSNNGCVGTIPALTEPAIDLYSQSNFGIPNGQLSGWRATPLYDENTPASPFSDTVGCVVELGNDTTDLSSQTAGDFFSTGRVQFDFSADLESGIALASDTVYFCYIDLNANTKFISDTLPLRTDIAGRRYYSHPHRVAVAVASYYRRDNGGTAINVDTYAIEQDVGFDTTSFSFVAETVPINLDGITASAAIDGVRFPVVLDAYSSAHTVVTLATWGGVPYGDYSLYSDGLPRAEAAQIPPLLATVAGQQNSVNSGRPFDTGNRRDGTFVDNSGARAALRQTLNASIARLNNLPVFTGTPTSSGVSLEAAAEVILSGSFPVLNANAGAIRMKLSCVAIGITGGRNQDPDNSFRHDIRLSLAMRARR